MSSIINLLPDSLANQIAAGEVIQRPASVVKELLENALDANASRIQLILKDSGKTLIQVVDDGVGMNEVDARMCFERHATSKINKTDDLFDIRTFGFRGEALASIAAVAHVELKTKTQDADLGTHIIIEGSVHKKQEACQTADGSSFTVKNLFFNVPARRKFLKSDPVELKHILEELVRVALPNPSIHFTVHHNGNEIYHLPPANLRQRLVGYFGKNSNEKIIPVEQESETVHITGFIGKADFIKKTRGDQYIFVNKRFIKSNYFNHAIKVAYNELLPKDYYPFYVLLLEVDPAIIDVNIHPTKQEVKFENERLIYNYLNVAVKHSLGKYSLSPTLDFEIDQRQIFQTGSEGTPRRVSSTQEYNYSDSSNTPNERKKWIDFYKDIKDNASQLPTPKKAITLSSDWSEEEPTGAEEIARNFFQIYDSYIVSPIKSGLLVMDQEAAHERILYEKYLNQLENKKILSQQVLFPETIQVDAQDVDLLDKLLPELQYVGFDIEKSGRSTYQVKTLPVEGVNEATSIFIDRLLQSYTDNVALELKPHDNIARSMARQNALRKGKKLAPEEIHELIDQLFACNMPFTSPSGRKCFITFDAEELQQHFKSK